MFLFLQEKYHSSNLFYSCVMEKSNASEKISRSLNGTKNFKYMFTSVVFLQITVNFISTLSMTRQHVIIKLMKL